jgi:cytochrome P450
MYLEFSLDLDSVVSSSLTSLDMLQGDEWKLLRKSFNAGFAPQSLLTWLPRILDQSFTFLDHLDKLATEERSFSLVELTGNLIFDVISGVVMDVDFGAQNIQQPGDFMRTYRELFKTYTNEQMDLPWFFTPLTEWKRRKLARRLRNVLRTIVHNAAENRGTEVNKNRSILSLSLKNDSGISTSKAIDRVCDQLSTFLFAGHDTTSVFISWMIYELSRTPHALQALRKELDDVFGTGTQHNRLVITIWSSRRLLSIVRSISDSRA